MNSPSADIVNKPNIPMCILSYFGIFSLIPYFTQREDLFVQWHAKQGLLIAAFSIVTYFVLFVLSMLPGIGIVAAIANMLFGLIVIGVSIFCIIQACSGNRWPVPGIGRFVSKVPA
jgi:fumarate reductase subunit D